MYYFNALPKAKFLPASLKSCMKPCIGGCSFKGENVVFIGE